jgi:hypothetical protein
LFNGLALALPAVALSLPFDLRGDFVKKLTHWLLFALAVVPLAETIAADACALTTNAEAAKVIGARAEDVKAMSVPPSQDKSGGYVSFCAYSSPAPNTLSVVVSVLAFHSNTEAKQKLTEALVHGRMEDATTQVSKEGDLGDVSFYAASNSGATYMFVKKNNVIGVATGGVAGKAAGSKKDLLKLAQTVAGRV